MSSYAFGLTPLLARPEAFTPARAPVRKCGRSNRRRPLMTEALPVSEPSPSPAPAPQGDWEPGKIHVSRPMRGVRRRTPGSLAVQGVPKRVNGRIWMPPRVRITSGTARGRKLISPSVYLRPMMGKVREALFSMLMQLNAVREDGAVLDLFAGLGSVGLEALSRGSRFGVFVDSSPECVAAIQENASHCGVAHRTRVVCERVEQFLTGARSYNDDEQPYALITVTPPYEEVDYGQLLRSVALSDAVGERTFVVVEYPVELGVVPPAIEHRLVGVRNRRYGRTMIAIYACQPSPNVELRPEEFTGVGRR